MKKFTPLLVMILLFSNYLNAQNSYHQLWEKVEQLEVENLPKSSLKIVEEIYLKADKENNAPQLIKTLFYKSKFALILEEDAQLKVINQFKEHIAKSKFPTKNVLENILANLYWQYFNQHRWQFYNRTQTSKKVDTSDFRTWDLNTLFEEIHHYYQASLKEKLLLQQVDVHEFANILLTVKGSKTYRPTLFDFLANNALEFYKTPETQITKPSYKFELDNHDLLCDASTFSRMGLQTKDSISLEFHALKIYQDLLGFHLKDKNPTALVDIDLQRLQFIKNNATFLKKDSLLLSTLKKSKNTYKKNEVSGLYAFEIANTLHQQANLYHPNNNNKNRFDNTKALQICEEIMQQFPESIGAKKCAQLKAKILTKKINITAERYVPIQINSRLLVNYKNINTLHFSAYKITRNQLNKLYKSYKDSSKIALIQKLKKTLTWSSTLRNEGDFLQHSTEVIVPKLAQGNYLIVATEDDDLQTHQIFGFANLQVTNLTLVEIDDDEKYSYQIVNRNNGKPINGAHINLKNYNTNNRYNFPIDKNFTSDKNGFFSYRSKSRHQQIIATVQHKKDKATFGNMYFYKNNRNSNDEDEEIIIKPFVFTDRSIYRPGQIVYFKAIVLKKTGAKTEPFTNEFIEVALNDVNGQEVKTLELKLNEYGSVAGEFILPNNGLTGQYSITIDESYEQDSKLYDQADYDFDYNNTTISVEEYKRPKFATEFKPITESYKINDSITVNGFAKAFAGSNITEAKVEYRVHRKVQYPRWYYWNHPQYNSENQEITHGETATDASGNFSIRFLAQPDKTVSKENLPVFTYEITADVTDINGETRSATTIVKVGYHALLAIMAIPTIIDKNSKDETVKISTKNLNGEFVSAKGSIQIYKLQAPKTVLRKRAWAAPYYQDISESEFRKLFPHEPYTDKETDEQNWEKGDLVFETQFDTSSKKELSLQPIENWISGKYIAILTSQDKFGQPVKDEQRFTVFSPNDKTIADNKLFYIKTDKQTYKPHDNAILQIGSASKDITLVLQIEKNHKVIKTQLVHLNNQIKSIRIPITNADIGGFAVRHHYVNYNHFDSGNLVVNVAEEQHPIQIETKTFRDKLKPGQDETWSFSIKNDTKDKIAAEVLASMYDASLDEFKPHQWQFNPIAPKVYYSYSRSNANYSFGTNNFRIVNTTRNHFPAIYQGYDTYNWFGFSFGRNRQMYLRSKTSRNGVPPPPSPQAISVVENESEVEGPFFAETKYEENTLDEVVTVAYGTPKNLEESTENKKVDSFDGVQIRTNLQEKAFFYPQLQTDKNGNISFNFTAPEALTRWKLQLLAHTKELQSATKTLTTITQKELMVLPNAPRFLREGDTLVFSTKISNLTKNSLNGQAKLILTDAVTGKEIDRSLGNIKTNKDFTVNTEGNTNVSWQLIIPKTAQAVQYKIVAKAGDFSDGEQNVLPVLSNRMLVTETLPMWVRSNQTKTFRLDKLASTSLNQQSTTLKNHKLTLEITSNPAWYAVQSLPYLMEYPYDCAEQTFARYYANTLVSYIANANPRIKEVFASWKSSDALLSNLEKNQELKSLIIQETPWLRDAQSETEQKKRIALLFDLHKMKNEQEKGLKKLTDMQLSSGGFPWFKGSDYPNAYITQHIASGFGHLKKLGVSNFDTSIKKMLHKAVDFLDIEITEQYQKLLDKAAKIKATKDQKEYEEYLKQKHIHYFIIQYLYMRSFYDDIPLNAKSQKAVAYYKNQSSIYWNDFNLYAKGQIALVQYRNGDKMIATKILKSLKENSISSEELGMYWKANVAGYYNYQAPVETQALLIEAFSEIENDIAIIDNLKIWLLKNKQTNRWKTTKATTEAVYALLLNRSDWISITDEVDITLGGKKIDTSTLEDTKIEAGTGYFKTSWNGSDITPKMGEVTLSKKGNGIAWGGLYWQYFEDLDKITSAETPLKLQKELFLKVNSDTGKKLIKIDKNAVLKVGDLITVRIELRVDRAMEFIHMKDMRASGVEPINVLSSYKWQDGLGYYESTKDAATNFFFDRLPKGIYVFEYDVRVNNAGNFSNGITTIQSMYAPEFSSHSNGVRISVQ